MDALSDLLRALRFESGVFLDACIRGPWCARSQVSAGDLGRGVAASGGLVGFHYVLDGAIQVSIGGQPALRAVAGDLILLPRNDVHLIGNDLRLPPTSVEPLVRRSDEHALPSIDHGDASVPGDRIVCGYLATALGAHPLLASLPPLLVVSMRDRPCAEWVASSFRYAAREHGARRPGSQSIVAQLSSLLFVEAVREHIDSLPADASGWLAAIRDPALGRALAALHARVAQPWTTEALAQEAFLSRSAFAERFTRTLGLPPMGYLTRWRMLLAAQRLRESPATIARIASEVGYESESTFSRAFSREMGAAPSAFRRGSAAQARVPHAEGGAA